MPKHEKPCPPAPGLLKRLLDHQRWLTSGGRFGTQLEVSELQFDDCDLSGIDLSRALIDYAYFKGGSLKGVNFSNADLSSATFDGCDVEDADFANADLSWALFLTNHEKAKFEGADLTRTAWSREQFNRNIDDFAASRGDPPRKMWPQNIKLKPK